MDDFYINKLTTFSADAGLKLSVTVNAARAGGISQQTLDELRAALRELGLDDEVHIE